MAKAEQKVSFDALKSWVADLRRRKETDTSFDANDFFDGLTYPEYG